MLPSSSFIQVQTNDFDQGHEYAQLACGTQVGAVVTFVGRVRDFSADTVKKLYLEHYPGMTESVLQQIASRAHSRWPLQQSRIIHRVGLLQPADQIVFVGVSAAHRQAAFSACAFIMDLPQPALEALSRNYWVEGIRPWAGL